MEKHSGILNQPAGELKFHLARHSPAPDLAVFVERYWIITWDLRGQAPHVQETLPNACVNLVIEPGNSRIYGVPRGKSARCLEEAGRVIGVKFRPGGFYPFARWPMTRLTGRSVPLQEVFDVDSRALEEGVLSAGDDGQMVARTEAFLRPRLPERDGQLSGSTRWWTASSTTARSPRWRSLSAGCLSASARCSASSGNTWA